jgi:hypothetical protein
VNYTKPKEIFYEQLGREILAFDANKNMPYILNSTAALIFFLINKKLEPEEIANRICRDYEVDFQEALRDVNSIINDLVNKEILVPSNSRS